LDEGDHFLPVESHQVRTPKTLMEKIIC
jgi:hypothetical protein